MAEFIRANLVDIELPYRLLVSETLPLGSDRPTTGYPDYEASPPYRDLCITRGTPRLTSDGGGDNKWIVLPVFTDDVVSVPEGEFWIIAGSKSGHNVISWYGPHKVKKPDGDPPLRVQYPDSPEITHLELELLA